MKVLYISNRIAVNKSEALSWLKLYCDNDSDLQLATDFEHAKDFLTNTIIDQQKHLDLVITDWEIKSKNANPLTSWIRQTENIYSGRNFQIKSLPVLLIEDTSTQSSSISDGFDGVLSGFPSNEFSLKQVCKSAIKKWRFNLADDLELIGLDPKTQRIYLGHSAKFIAYHRLQVITRNFVDRKHTKTLNYIWTNSDLDNLHRSNQMFEDKMNWTRKVTPKYLEKEFHDFFLSNPTFIKGEDFVATPDQMLYEKHLYKGGTKKYDEPDFINKPHEYALRNPEIFEIKRHTQRLMHRSGKSMLSRVRDSFKQVKRYKEYMESNDPRNHSYIERYLGRLFTQYEYTLLMGSYTEKEEHRDMIERLRADFGFEEINLVTYEELLEKHVRLCERLSDFSVF